MSVEKSIKELKNIDMKNNSNKISSSYIKDSNNENKDGIMLLNEKINVLEKALKVSCNENEQLYNRVIELEALNSATKDELEDYENIILELNTNYNALLEKYKHLWISREDEKPKKIKKNKKLDKN